MLATMVWTFPRAGSLCFGEAAPPPSSDRPWNGEKIQARDYADRDRFGKEGFAALGRGGDLERWRQAVCKPGSVSTAADFAAVDGHSSGTSVAGRLARPTRAARRGNPPAGRARHATPMRSCSRWGLPCHDRYRPRGALLPHPFTLTRRPWRRAVCFLWHFPWGRPRRALPGTVFPWSPDFPPPPPEGGEGDRPTAWRETS